MERKPLLYQASDLLSDLSILRSWRGGAGGHRLRHAAEVELPDFVLRQTLIATAAPLHSTMNLLQLTGCSFAMASSAKSLHVVLPLASAALPVHDWYTRDRLC